MNVFEIVLYNLSGKAEMPTPFGLFHIICLFITFLFTVFLCIRFKEASYKTEKLILIIIWGILVVLEIYKQLVYSAHFSESQVVWRYKWDSFPFQFCSSPLYLLPLAALPKKESFRDIMRMFFATYSLFGGLVVMVYPEQVFSSFIGISIQSMVHHGAMVAIGVYLGGRLVRENKMTIKRFAQASLVFIAMLTIAMALNISAPLFTDQVFNMFYISPYFPTTLAILDKIYPVVPYPVSLLIYIVGFSAIAFIIFCCQLVLRPSWRQSHKKVKL